MRFENENDYEKENEGEEESAGRTGPHSLNSSFIRCVKLAGGRTGLTAIVTGLLFLLALWFSPLAAMVPSYATAGALLYVATLMLTSLQHVEWDDVLQAVPVALCLLDEQGADVARVLDALLRGALDV